LNSLLALACSTILPTFTSWAEWLAERRVEEHHEMSFARRIWKRSVDVWIECWRLRGIWAISNLFLAVALLSTWLVENAFQAVLLVAVCGFPWAIATWAPFAMVGHVVSSDESCIDWSPRRASGSHDACASDQSDTARNMESGLAAAVQATKRYSATYEAAQTDPSPSLDAGVALGIHNIYIVLPQLVSTGVSAIIFAILADEDTGDNPPDQPTFPVNSHEPVGWVLRFGGMCALIAAILATRCVQDIRH
jgi:solute carrier family 45 protein 1/2/4